MSTAERSGTPAAPMQRTIQRSKACITMMAPNSNSDNAGMAPAARWAEDTMGPLNLFASSPIRHAPVVEIAGPPCPVQH